MDPVEDTWLITVEGAEILKINGVEIADAVVSVIRVASERVIDNALAAETGFVSGEGGRAMLSAKKILGPLFG